MNNGTVKWFNETKGIGFISIDNCGEDVFVHFSSILGNGFRSLQNGQKVLFDVLADPRNHKLQAINVRVA